MKNTLYTITLSVLLLASLFRIPFLIKTHKRDEYRYHYEYVIG